MKTAAIVVGGTLTLVALMSIAGLFIDSGWLRLLCAVIVAVGVPAVVADRLVPSDPKQGKGIISNTFALAWLGFAVAFVGPAIPLTRDMLHDEAERLAQSDYQLLSRGTYWLAGSDGNAAAKPVIDAPANDDVGTAVAVAPQQPADAGPEGTGDAGKATVADKAKNGKADKTKETGPLTPAELFEKWAPSVVTVQVRKGLMGEGGGTGFIIGADGTMVTNHHVIDGADDVEVKLMDGSWASDVELLVSDKDADIAILRIKTKTIVPSIGMGDSDKVAVGERAISIGNPLGLEHTLTDGLVSARRTIRGRKLIQMSTPISPGNSGGPLFNLAGEVIGVSTATLSGYGVAQNLNLAVPINTVKGILKDKYPDKKRIGGGGPGNGTW